MQRLQKALLLVALCATAAEGRDQVVRNSGQRAVGQDSSAAVSFDSVVIEEQELRQELVNANNNKNKVKSRLNEMSEVAHQGLRAMHKMLNVAKENAAKSLHKLNTQYASTEHSTEAAQNMLKQEQHLEADETLKVHSAQKTVKELTRRLITAERVGTRVKSSGKATSGLRAKFQLEEKSESALRTKVAATEKIASKVTATEKAQSALRTKLAAAEKLEVSEGLEMAKAQAKLRLQLASEMNATNSERASEARVESALRAKLAAAVRAKAKQQQAAFRSQGQLRATLKSEQGSASSLSQKLTLSQKALMKENSTLTAGMRERAQLQARLKASTKESAQTKTKLGSEEKADAKLRVSIEEAVNKSAAADNATHREKMGLLNQLAELQETTANKKSSASAAEQQAGVEIGRAAASLKEHQERAKQEEEQYKSETSELQEHERAQKAQLDAVDEDVQVAKSNVSNFTSKINKLDKRLKASLLQADTLRSSNNLTARNVATEQSKLTAAESELQQVHSSLSSSTQESEQVKQELASQVNQTNQLRSQVKSLLAESLALNKTLLQGRVQAKAQLKSVLANAASQIKSLEASNISLHKEITKEKTAEAAAIADASKSKDTLVQESNLAMDSQKRADDLADSLETTNHEVDNNTQKLTDIKGVAEELKTSQKATAALLDKRTHEDALWEAKAKALQNKSAAVHSREQKAEAENKKLRDQFQQLSGESDRARELSDMINTLRSAAQKNATHRSDMARELKENRDLKDHYSTEYEAWRNESDTWHERATDLKVKVADEDRRLKAALQLRNDASDKAKEAKSHEDEYFEENAQLKEQKDGLEEQAQDAIAKSNETVEAEQEVQQRMDVLTKKEKKDQDDYNAAWVKNEHDMMQARHDSKVVNLLKSSEEADLQHMRALLNDTQRKALGMPSLHPAKATAKAPSAVQQPALVARALAGPLADSPAPITPTAASTAPHPALRLRTVKQATPQPAASPVLLDVPVRPLALPEPADDEVAPVPALPAAEPLFPSLSGPVADAVAAVQPPAQAVGDVTAVSAPQLFPSLDASQAPVLFPSLDSSPAQAAPQPQPPAAPQPAAAAQQPAAVQPSQAPPPAVVTQAAQSPPQPAAVPVVASPLAALAQVVPAALPQTPQAPAAASPLAALAQVMPAALPQAPQAAAVSAPVAALAQVVPAAPPAAPAAVVVSPLAALAQVVPQASADVSPLAALAVPQVDVAPVLFPSLDANPDPLALSAVADPNR